jgi:hypothetical protein
MKAETAPAVRPLARPSSTSRSFKALRPVAGNTSRAPASAGSVNDGRKLTCHRNGGAGPDTPRGGG